jgi:hypothetical protein
MGPSLRGCLLAALCCLPALVASYQLDGLVRSSSAQPRHVSRPSARAHRVCQRVVAPQVINNLPVGTPPTQQNAFVQLGKQRRYHGGKNRTAAGALAGVLKLMPTLDTTDPLATCNDGRHVPLAAEVVGEACQRLLLPAGRWYRSRTRTAVRRRVCCAAGRALRPPLRNWWALDGSFAPLSRLRRC